MVGLCWNTITELGMISTETLSNIYIQSYSNLAADNILISPSRYILKYSSTLLKFIVQKVLTVLLPFHDLDLKLVNVWPQKQIFFTLTFSTFNLFFFKEHFNVFFCLSVESILLRQIFGKLWRTFFGPWYNLFWF